MRETTRATASEREREGLGSMRESRPRERREPRTAATWPWGRERTMAMRALGLQGVIVLEVGDSSAALEQSAEALDEVRAAPAPQIET